MKIFKIKDKTDGNFARVIAENEQEAITILKEFTTLKLEIIDIENLLIKESKKIIYNYIVPF